MWTRARVTEVLGWSCWIVAGLVIAVLNMNKMVSRSPNPYTAVVVISGFAVILGIRAVYRRCGAGVTGGTAGDGGATDNAGH